MIKGPMQRRSEGHAVSYVVATAVLQRNNVSRFDLHKTSGCAHSDATYRTRCVVLEPDTSAEGRAACDPSLRAGDALDLFRDRLEGLQSEGDQLRLRFGDLLLGNRPLLRLHQAPTAVSDQWQQFGVLRCALLHQGETVLLQGIQLPLHHEHVVLHGARTQRQQAIGQPTFGRPCASPCLELVAHRRFRDPLRAKVQFNVQLPVHRWSCLSGQTFIQRGKELPKVLGERQAPLMALGRTSIVVSQPLEKSDSPLLSSRAVLAEKLRVRLESFRQ